MILELIILVSICQIGLYVLAGKMNLKYGKIITFLIVLIGHLFILPQFFYHGPIPGRINCGMPNLGITLVFWVIGGGTAILIHLINYLFEKFGKKLLRES